MVLIQMKLDMKQNLCENINLIPMSKISYVRAMDTTVNSLIVKIVCLKVLRSNNGTVLCKN